MWFANHRYGPRCRISLADAIARSGMTAKQLEQRVVVQLTGDWTLTKEGVV
jgi:hypothetical protein